VIIIAQPSSIFGNSNDEVNSNKAGVVDDVTPAQRFLAIVISIIGVFGASGAYTTIRVIGDRAHALISVNYFAILGTVGSTFALLVIPGIGFTMPQGPREWILLVVLGTLGFVLQFLLTTGLQIDKSSKATSMMYTQVIFDWGIWGVLPGLWSIIGGLIVIASTLWSALQKTPKAPVDDPKSAIIDEESSLLGAQTGSIEEVVRRGASAA
jgi:drug/metabolite transporter (DMT)-like permease